MVILGVSDVPTGAAAVVVDDELVAVVSEESLGETDVDGPIPWRTIEAALALADVSVDEVDVVAFAGRYSLPLVVRRRPWLRRIVTQAASPLLDLTVVWQAIMRSTGFGAYEADVAAEWLDGQFKARGFGHGRLVTIDAHKALAEAAYRMQPDDESLVVTLQPMGDGAGLSVHRGRAGQLDRLYVQDGFDALHVHLPRALDALGLRPDEAWRLGDLAAAGEADPQVQAALARDLHAEGGRLSRLPVRGRRERPPTEALAHLDRHDAAAAVFDNLVAAVVGVVGKHVRQHGLGTVALAGDAVDHPRLVARVAEQVGLEHLHVLPRPGRDALAVGAAVSQAGLAPRARALTLGQGIDDHAARRALDGVGLVAARKASLVGRLVQGEPLVRARDRVGPGRHGLGTRAVLVRADDAVALDRVRTALGLGPEEQPLVVAVPTANEVLPEQAGALAGPLSTGMAAVKVDPSFVRRYGPAVGPDGRVTLLRATEQDHPSLHQLGTALLRQSGCGAFAAFALQDPRGALARRPADVVGLYRRLGVGALQLGTLYVEQDAP